MAVGTWVSYLRVSTRKQGYGGLGIEAQREAVRRFLDGGDWTLLKEHVEVESGRLNRRPELEKALALCRASGARLVIAKLDRLSRNAAFLLQLRDAGVKFVAADMPDATELTVGILAVVAEEESRRIRQRTRDGLAVIRRKLAAGEAHVSKAGLAVRRLGNPNGAAPLRKAGRGNTAALAAIRAKADRFAADVAPIVEDIRSHGIATLRDVAAELNARQIRRPRSTGPWTATAVWRLRVGEAR